MNKLLAFFLLVVSIHALDPTIKNALRNQVVIDFKNAIVPIISAQIHHMDLPDVHSKHSGVDVSVTNIHIEVNQIAPSQINIQFIPGTSNLVFAGTALGMQGKAHIKAKYKIIHKSTDATVTVSGASFDIKIKFLSVNGKPNIVVEHVNLGISSHHVSIKLHGGLISKIINFVIDLMKGHIVKHVVSTLDSKVPPIVTNLVNSALNTLPSDIPVTPTINMKYSFPYAPNVKNDYLFTGILAYLHPKTDPNPPPFPIKAMPEFDAGLPRGIQFFFSDYVIKSFLYSGFKLNLLIISMNKNLLGHQILMSCKPPVTPEFNFKNAIVAEVQAVCDVTLDNDANQKFSLKFTAYASLKEYIKSAVLFFSIDKTEFKNIEYILPKPINIDWFKNGINTILNALAEAVNGEIGTKGIPLPTIKQATYNDLTQLVKDGYMEIGTNPQFHFSAEPEITE